MMKEQTSSIQHVDIIVQIIALLIMIYIPVYMQIIIYTMIIAWEVRRLDIYKPNCWFSIIYYLCSVAYPLLYVWGKLNINRNFGCSNRLIPIEYVGWFFFKLGLILVEKKNVYRRIRIINSSFQYPIGVMNIVVLLGDAILVLAIVSILRTGFYNKKDLYSNSNVFILFSVRYVLLHTIFTFFLWLKSGEIKPGFFLFFSISLIVLLGLVSGERDFYFRVFFMLGMILIQKKVIKKRHIFIIVPTVLLIVPLSSSLKYVFMGLGKNSFTIGKSLQDIISSFLQSGFLAGDQNLQAILINFEQFDSFHWSDIFFTIINNFINLSWYATPESYFGQNVVIAGKASTGVGFSLIGECMIYGGVLETCIVMFILGAMLQIIYKRSFLSPFDQIAYLFTGSLYVYALRTGISAIISPMIKYLFVSYFIIALTGAFNYDRKES